MASTSPGMPTMAAILLVLAVFIAAGISFGFVQTLLIVAIGASMAMFCAFLVVASSKDAH